MQLALMIQVNIQDRSFINMINVNISISSISWINYSQYIWYDNKDHSRHEYSEFIEVLHSKYININDREYIIFNDKKLSLIWDKEEMNMINANWRIWKEWRIISIMIEKNWWWIENDNWIEFEDLKIMNMNVI